MEIIKSIADPNNIIIWNLLYAGSSVIILWLMRTGFYKLIIFKSDQEIERIRSVLYGEQKRKVSDERQARILEYINKFTSTEFIEIPHGYIVEPALLRDSSSIAAQTARLKWQLNRPERLHLERASDLLICIFRQNVFSVSFPTVKLVEDSNYNLVITIECDLAIVDIVGREIKTHIEWIGMDVRLVKRVPVIYRGCKTAPMDGTLGGILVNAKGHSFGATCAHAMSENCCSLDYRTNLSPTEIYQPDVALINLESNKNCYPKSTRTSTPLTVSHNVKELQTERAAIKKLFPASSRVSGYIFAEIGSFGVDDKIYRFPHLEIYPRLFKYGPFIWPLWRNAFSYPGDSGSWVVDSDNGWVGMVVAGRENHQSSFLVEAMPLVEYLNGALKENFTPLRYSKTKPKK